MATEPITITGAPMVVTGLLGTLLGPVYGQAVLMLFAALVGAMLALGSVKTENRWESVRFLGVAVGISVVFTGATMWAVETYTPLPSNIALMPVSCLLAATRNRILWVIDKLIGWSMSKLTGKEETCE